VTPHATSTRTRTTRTRGIRYWGATLIAAVGVLALQAPVAANAALADPWMDTAPRSMSGWNADFVDDFKTLNTAVWGRYQGGAPAGSHAVYTPANAYIDSTSQIGDGVLQMETKYADGGWTTAGLSSGRGFWATQGKWVMKAKFDRAYGVGYAFLLYPKGGGWPPEIDIAEGTAGGPSIMSTFHYGTTTSRQQEQKWLYGVNMAVWHTYGVTITSGRIAFTLDGRETGVINNTATPEIPMWIGMQAGVKDCAKSTGECLSAATPASSKISIDWVAHYQATP
jgi:hypothetical protein